MGSRFLAAVSFGALFFLGAPQLTTAQELAQTYSGELRAGLWYSSDDGPQASVTLLRENVLGTQADLRFGLEGSAY